MPRFFKWGSSVFGDEEFVVGMLEKCGSGEAREEIGAVLALR